MNNNELLQAMSQMMDEKFGGRFDAIDRRFEAMDQRFEAMDKRFDDMEERFNKRIDDVETRFEARFNDIEERFEKRFDDIEERFEKRFDDIEERFDKRCMRIERKMDDLWEEKVTISRNLSTMNAKLDLQVIPRLNMLTENYLPAAQKFSAAADNIYEMQQDIQGLKNIVAENVCDYIKDKK